MGLCGVGGLEKQVCTAYWQHLEGGVLLKVDRQGIHFNSQQPIQTTEWQGGLVPYDPTIAQYAHFLVDGQAIDAWRFPNALAWDEPDEQGERHRLSLLWPKDYDPSDVLGRILEVE